MLFYMIFLAKKFVLSMIIRIFAATESATLPIRTANQGGSFAFYGYIKYYILSRFFLLYIGPYW